MTMSLSVARPIVAEPLGLRIAPDRDGSNAWNILVARLDTDVSPGLGGALGDICVGGAWTEPTGPLRDICGCGWKLAGGGPGGLPGGGGGGPPGGPA